MKKGITLIALIITIIVLLILAGVSIALVIGDSGIVSKAMSAKTQSAVQGVNEAAEIIRGEYQTHNNGEDPTARYIIEKLIEKNEITASQVEDYGDDSGVGIVVVEGKSININGKEFDGNIGINICLEDPKLNGHYGYGNKIILGFSNVYDEDEDLLIREIYEEVGPNFRTAYQNHGHEDTLFRGSFEWTASRRGFSFEEVLGAAIVKSGIRDYNIRVTTDNGQTNVDLNMNDSGYVEDLYFAPISYEEKIYKITITDPQGNESWRLVKAKLEEIQY